MSIQAPLSSTEIVSQLTDRFVGTFFEGRLINAPSISYQPGVTNDTTFLANEVTLGFGGYQRQVIGYYAGDVSSYSDGGAAMLQKATVFPQDGSTDTISFSHAALVESTGNVLTTEIPTSEPSPVNDGTFQALPVTSLSGTGEGLKIDLQVISNVSTITINNAGRQYAVGDSLRVPESVLVSAGVGTSGCGSLDFAVATVATSSENLFSVAKTTNQVLLAGGNEAVFYWNIKLFNQGG